MACDLCGKQGSTVLAKIEGTPYRVCSECARYGEVVREKRAKKKRAPRAQPDLVVVADAGRRIRSAREGRGQKQEDLAKSLAVKASDLHAWETGHRTPTVDMARRLERSLGVSLVEEPSGGDEYRPAGSSSGSLTIGDMLKKR